MKRIFQNEKKSMDKLDSAFYLYRGFHYVGSEIGTCFLLRLGILPRPFIGKLLPIRESATGSLFGIINGYEFTGFTGLASHGATIAAILGFGSTAENGRILKCYGYWIDW